MLGIVNAISVLAVSADTVEFFESLKSFAFVAIVTVACVLGAKIVSFLNEKIKDSLTKAAENSKLNEIDAAHQAMADIIDIIHDTVERLNETMKSEIIKASQDGKITPEEGKQIFNEAMRIIKTCVPESTIEDLSSIVGDIDEWITNQIEIWVAKTKNN